MSLHISLKLWDFVNDELLPLKRKAPGYFLLVGDLAGDQDRERVERIQRTMLLAPRHCFVVPVTQPSKAPPIWTVNVWPAVRVGDPLTELDMLRIATLPDAPAAYCRVVLSPVRSQVVLAAAAAVGAIVVEEKQPMLARPQEV